VAVLARPSWVGRSLAAHDGSLIGSC